MDFRLGSEADALRTEVRAFLDRYLTDDIRAFMERTGTHHNDTFARAMGAARGGDEGTRGAAALPGGVARTRTAHDG